MRGGGGVPGLLSVWPHFCWAMRQLILGSHTPPCHRRMVIEPSSRKQKRCAIPTVLRRDAFFALLHCSADRFCSLSVSASLSLSVSRSLSPSSPFLFLPLLTLPRGFSCASAASVGGGRGSKRSAPLFHGPQGEPTHGLHPRFVVAEIWGDRGWGGWGGLGEGLPRTAKPTARVLPCAA